MRPFSSTSRRPVPAVRLTALLPCLALGWSGSAQSLADPPMPGTTGVEWEGMPRRSADTEGAARDPEWFQPPVTGVVEPPLNPSLGTSALPSLGEPSVPRLRSLTSSPPSGSAPRTAPLQWGKLSVHPHVSYNFLYGTGILSGPNREEDTVLQTLSPGVTFRLGPLWSVDYTPSLQFYSNDAYEDTLDHAVSLRGTALSPGWMFSLGYGFRSSSPPLLETAAQTAQDTHALNLGANHSLDARTRLELGVAQYLRFTQSYTDSYTWSTTDWLDYEWDPRFAAALGVSLAYDRLEPGTDMTSQRVLGRIRGDAGTKFGYSLSGGLEWRQFLDTDAPTKLSPTMEGALTYRLFETTTLSVSASHDIGTSYFSEQFTETTTFSGGLRQRLLGKVYLGVSGGYSMQQYASTLVADDRQRQDDGLFFQSGLSTRFLRRGNVSVYYRWSENDSDQGGYSYDSSTIGLQLSYAL